MIYVARKAYAHTQCRWCSLYRKARDLVVVYDRRGTPALSKRRNNRALNPYYEVCTYCWSGDD